MKTAIINVIIMTMNNERQIYQDGFIVFEQDKITAIGDRKDYTREADCVEIDGKGGILMPGMVNLHAHLGMIPFRGLQDDCVDRFRKFLLPIEKEEMSPEMVYASTRYAISEMLLSGITTVLDMYYFEKEAAKAASTMEIRGVFGQTIISQDVCDFHTPKESLAYTQEFIDEYKNDPLITPCVAPHGTSTCTEEILKESFALAEKNDVPFTIHTAEMDYEMKYFREKYDMTPVEFLDSLGVLAPRVIAGHCISMSEHDLELMKEKGASVAHCIGSNTKAAKGVAPVREMLQAGIPVGLGTDGPASGNTLDLITQFKLFANFHKNTNHDRSAFPAEKIITLGTIGGAQALHMDKEIGSLEVGKQADLVLLETESVNMFPVYDPYSTLVYSANSSNVSTVFVAGKCVVRDKKLVNHDLSTLRREMMEQMTKKEHNLFQEYLLSRD